MRALLNSRNRKILVGCVHFVEMWSLLWSTEENTVTTSCRSRQGHWYILGNDGHNRSAYGTLRGHTLYTVKCGRSKIDHRRNRILYALHCRTRSHHISFSDSSVAGGEVDTR